MYVYCICVSFVLYRAFSKRRSISYFSLRSVIVSTMSILSCIYCRVARQWGKRTTSFHPGTRTMIIQ